MELSYIVIYHISNEKVLKNNSDIKMWRMKERRHKRDHPLLVTKRQDGGWNFASEPEVKSSLYTRSPWCMHWMMDGFLDGWIDGWIDWWIGSHWVFWGFVGIFQDCLARRRERRTRSSGATESAFHGEKTVRHIAAEAHNQSSMRNSWIGWLPTCFSIFVRYIQPLLERIWWSRDGHVPSQLLA